MKTGQETIEKLINDTAEIREARKTRFNENRAFLLESEQWDSDDEEQEKVEETQSLLTFNQLSSFIEYYLAKLFPRDSQTNTVDIGVAIKGIKDVKERGKYEEYILNTYGKENLILSLLEQGQNFLVGGNACFYYPFDEGIQRTRIFSIDPRNVYYKFEGNDLVEFAFVEGDLTANDAITRSVSNGTEKKYNGRGIVRQVTDAILGADRGRLIQANKVVYWSRDQHIETVNNEVKINEPNRLGYMPATWVANRPIAHTHEGRSEVTEAERILQKEYNKRGTNFSYRVKKNTKPKLAVFSGKQLDAMKNSDEQSDIFQLGVGEDMKPLDVPENKEVLDYLVLIDNHIKRMKGMNEATEGIIKTHISGITMAYAFGPLLDRIGLRRVYFDHFFRNLNMAILMNKGIEKAEEIQTEPVYNSILAVDYDQKVENTVKLYESHLISLDKALDLLHGADMVDEEKDRILDDLARVEEQQLKLIDKKDENMDKKVGGQNQANFKSQLKGSQG